MRCEGWVVTGKVGLVDGGGEGLLPRFFPFLFFFLSFFLSFISFPFLSV